MRSSGKRMFRINQPALAQSLEAYIKLGQKLTQEKEKQELLVNDLRGSWVGNTAEYVLERHRRFLAEGVFEQTMAFVSDYCKMHEEIMPVINRAMSRIDQIGGQLLSDFPEPVLSDLTGTAPHSDKNDGFISLDHSRERSVTESCEEALYNNMKTRSALMEMIRACDGLVDLSAEEALVNDTYRKVCRVEGFLEQFKIYAGEIRFIDDVTGVQKGEAAEERKKEVFDHEVKEKLKEILSQLLERLDKNITDDGFALSEDYIEWLRIAEGEVLYPYQCKADNDKAKATMTVTMGIGFTFNSKRDSHWDIIHEVLGWNDDEINDVIDAVYDGQDLSGTKYALTKEQSARLHQEVQKEYIEGVMNAIELYNKESGCENVYTQTELEAMVDFAYNNNGFSDLDRVVNDPKYIFYYYLRRDLEGAADAMHRYGGDGNRRRLNQVHLFFYGNYDFSDSPSELDVLRQKFGIEGYQG